MDGSVADEPAIVDNRQNNLDQTWLKDGQLGGWLYRQHAANGDPSDDTWFSTGPYGQARGRTFPMRTP
jgi:hypothetical protein